MNASRTIMPAALMRVLPRRRDAPTQDELGQHEQDAAAIQRREGEEIEHTQADRQDADQLQGEVRGSLGGGGRGGRGGGLRGSGYRD